MNFILEAESDTLDNNRTLCYLIKENSYDQYCLYNKEWFYIGTVYSKISAKDFIKKINNKLYNKENY